jgi:hypothetical protein
MSPFRSATITASAIMAIYLTQCGSRVYAAGVLPVAPGCESVNLARTTQPNVEGGFIVVNGANENGQPLQIFISEGFCPADKVSGVIGPR